MDLAKGVSFIHVCPMCWEERRHETYMSRRHIDRRLDLRKDIVYLIIKMCATEGGANECRGVDMGRGYTEEEYRAEVEMTLANNGTCSALANGGSERISCKVIVWGQSPM
jgi:hypothetical protein